MDIYFACPSCHKRLMAEESMAGSQAECPQCHASVPIPIPVVARPAGEAAIIPRLVSSSSSYQRAAVQGGVADELPAGLDVTGVWVCTKCVATIKTRRRFRWFGRRQASPPPARRCRQCGAPMIPADTPHGRGLLKQRLAL